MYCQNELCGYLNLEHKKKDSFFPAFFFVGVLITQSVHGR